MVEYYTYEQIVEEPQPPDVSHLITEDDAPVDSLPSEKNLGIDPDTL